VRNSLPRVQKSLVSTELRFTSVISASLWFIPAVQRADANATGVGR
jgi:hypothetical protein